MKRRVKLRESGISQQESVSRVAELNAIVDHVHLETSSSSMRIARRQKSHRKCYQSRMAFRLLRCLVNALIAFIRAREP